MASPSENDDQDGGPHNSGQPKPKQTYGERFRVFAISTAKGVYAKAHKYKASKAERDRLTIVIRRGFWAIAGNRVIQAAFAAIVIAAMLYWLWSEERLEPDWTMAIFTAALTAIAAVQWWTAHRQWEAMHAQNEIMIAESKKTDAIIEQMRVEQRAWLTVINATIGAIKEGEQLKCNLTITNTGMTPGMILSGHIYTTTRRPDYPIDDLIAEFEGQGFTESEKFIVPPGKEVNIVLTNLGALRGEQFADVFSEGAKLHLLCRFLYVDVMGRTHSIKAFYTLDLKDRGLYLRNNYGSMD